jgi:hypothetical protein
MSPYATAMRASAYKTTNVEKALKELQASGVHMGKCGVRGKEHWAQKAISAKWQRMIPEIPFPSEFLVDMTISRCRILRAWVLDLCVVPPHCRYSCLKSKTAQSKRRIYVPNWSSYLCVLSACLLCSAHSCSAIDRIS